MFLFHVVITKIRRSALLLLGTWGFLRIVAHYFLPSMLRPPPLQLKQAQNHYRRLIEGFCRARFSFTKIELDATPPYGSHINTINLLITLLQYTFC